MLRINDDREVVVVNTRLPTDIKAPSRREALAALEALSHLIDDLDSAKAFEAIARVVATRY